jgi:hypothetical protein
MKDWQTYRERSDIELLLIEAEVGRYGHRALGGEGGGVPSFISLFDCIHINLAP